MAYLLKPPGPDVDPHLVPAFSLKFRLRRLLWEAVRLLFFRLTPRPLFAVRSAILRCFGATIGGNNFIYPTARIWAPWQLKTDDVVTIGPDAEIYNPGGAILGHHAIVSQCAFLCGATHDYNDPGFPLVSKAIYIAPYGWVCARAVVLPGVVVGEGAVLGAAAVAARSLDPWGVYAGNPAKKVAERKRAEGA